MTPGSHIGQYRIIRKLGAGGMGTVYLAEHILLGRQAAIKTLLPTLSVHREIVERFFNEARATSAIADPGVVQVFDFGYHVDGSAYIVMELLEGEALSERMERLGALPQSDALKIARQIASALGAAHERGIIHRDLKPENIYLVHDAEAQGGERTKILDFGICKLPRNDKLTQSGATLGTPVYMSPEQCRGTGAVDQRSDIYALGCVLFHMLTARTPFECEGVGEYIVAHMQQEPPTASSVAPDLHPLVDVLLIRCLAKEPDERYRSMAELQDAIGQVMSKLSAPGLAPALRAAAPVLGEGFRSGNGSDEPPPAETPGEWFVDTPAPDSPYVSYAGEQPLAGMRMSRGRRFSITMITLGALVTALFATRAALGEGVASDVPQVSPAVAEVLGAPTVMLAMRDSPPPQPPSEGTIDRIDDPSAAVLLAVVEASTATPAPAPPPVRARAVNRPARREVIETASAPEDAPVREPAPPPPAAPPPPPPTEDLYDTR